MKTTLENGKLTVYLAGHIDSANANSVETEINSDLEKNPHDSLILDLADLEYISSAGLRVILKLRKKYSELNVINVSSEVYEIFDMTGFTELMNVSKAFRTFSVDGCEIIGKGANGTVYRIDNETIVKVYSDAGALDMIKRERELARTAFVMGIPTAISYDVVKVGDTYGSVFELLDAHSYAQLLREDESRLEELAQKSAEIALKIHSLEAPDNLPDETDVVLGWIERIRGFLTEAEHAKFLALIDELHDRGTMIHGDYHIKNIMMQENETLLIDMDTLSKGHPIYELGFMYNAYKGFGITDPKVVEDFMGFSSDTAYRFWRRSLAYYLGTEDEARLDEVERKASLIGLLRLSRRAIDKGEADTEKGKAFVDACLDSIRVLLAELDTIDF